MVVETYFPIESDSRFPLNLDAVEKQPLSKRSFDAPEGTYIYAIVGGGKMYVGSSRSKYRAGEHKNGLIKNRHFNRHLQRSFALYSLSEFYFQVVIAIPSELVRYRVEIENAYIRHFDSYNNGFNLSEFSDAPWRGKTLSLEHRAKIARATIGNKRRAGKIAPIETRRKISMALTGAGNYWFGKKQSLETCLKRSASLSKRIFPLISPTGQRVNVVNLANFCRQNNLDDGHMSHVTNGIRKSHKKWRLCVLILLLASALPLTGTDLATLRPKGGALSTVTAAASTATNSSAQSFVDDLLATLAASNSADGTLDISGGTYAAPTLPKFVIDFNNLTVTGNHTYGSISNASWPLIEISNDVGNLADSHVTFDGSDVCLSVGDLDTPTKQQIITKLVSVGGGKIVDNGGLVITVSPANYDLEPFDFTGMTGSSLTQGGNEVGTLRRVSNWTLTTN